MIELYSADEARKKSTCSYAENYSRSKILLEKGCAKAIDNVADYHGGRMCRFSMEKWLVDISEQDRDVLVRDLEDKLKSLGYNVVVADRNYMDINWI